MPTTLTTPAEELLRGPIKSKTVFPVLILHMLAVGPEHGFGLMQRIAGVCSGVLAVNTNTIYPLLRRLEERGFISGAWDHPTKRARRIYSITPAGRERLARIKANMLPYLDHLAASVERLRSELYGVGERTAGDLELAEDPYPLAASLGA
jgi:PadR family transcriptional regulator PadR